MATILLQVVGSAVGGAIGGPFGAVLGRAIGGIAGAAIDQQLFSKDQVIQGPRLDAARFLTSSEGAAIPKTYGQTRLGGQIIWATRFKENITTETSSGGGGGGKGGGSGPKTTTTTYSYSANFAVGICQGPISGIRRIWADGSELDLTTIEYRLYRGTEDQEPDPLIEAKQGSNNAPAYRGTAYIVFEALPLEKYGNRVPQISVEIIRQIDGLGPKIKSITVIPGATEFGYLPQAANSSAPSSEVYRVRNRHNTIASTDWQASIDELQMMCPNLETVSLVIAWFGTDLRAGQCDIRPKVEHQSDSLTAEKWQVSGITAGTAQEVSRISGNPAFGGTPSDHTILAAIADLKSRGLKVMLYPFILMDIQDGNAKQDPYGNPEQAAFPWRGMVTCNPAIDQPATADQTSLAGSQITDFCGNAAVGNFPISGNSVGYSGPAEWSFRRMILHYAKIGALAGGLDGYIIGSEMRGLTSVRDDVGNFPFVSQLVALSDDVKSVLGSSCNVTYAADWSEYFGYHPQDGSNDIYFNLDPLWANDSIDTIGIDNYMPLSDLRDGNEFQPGISVENLQQQINSAEGYDWFYASSEDRLSSTRTPITDGLNEPWVWRYKDLVSWWENDHHERVNDVRSASPTAWVPQSKPLVFTEIGCPAIDKGSNQPNVFYDEKSDQSDIPYFSTGGRDDLVQNRFLQAHFAHWDSNNPDFDPLDNPSSSQYSGRMIDPSDIAIWTWDARPFPWFPQLSSVWSDGPNWQRGHWLNGRLAGCPLDSLISVIMQDFGYTNFRCQVDGFVDGYLVPNAISLRLALEPLVALFGILISEEDSIIVFRSKAYCPRPVILPLDIVQEKDQPAFVYNREHEAELPREAIVSHTSISGNYEQTSTKTRRLVTNSERQVTMSLPMVLPSGAASVAGEERIRDFWVAQDKLQFALGQKYSMLSPGDIITFDEGDDRKWLVEQADTGNHRMFKTRAIADLPKPARNQGDFSSIESALQIAGPASVELMDLPLLANDDATGPVSHCAVFANPWVGTHLALSSPTTSGFQLRAQNEIPSTIGELLEPLGAGPSGRWDLGSQLHVTVYFNALQSVAEDLVLNGANALAVKCNNGGWEIIQFTDALLQEDGSWILSNLLRGQLGSEEEMASGALAGSRIALLNQAITPIQLESYEKGLELNWQIGPLNEPYGSGSYISLIHANNGRSKQAFSPVHLRSNQETNGDISLNWIRRSRLDADSWEGVEIPLGESSERYQIRILDVSDTELRVLETSIANATYTDAMRIEDFGSGSGTVKFSIAQIASSGLPGAERSVSISY
ncbi:MAG: hypothetical protein COB78_08480 [Hyphomicrobiales bacterium]|nr:MAG: hypothetical protein COB78_08480 [Hyphomicrobiales bacterium]